MSTLSKMASLKERFERCVRAMLPAAGQGVAEATCEQAVVRSRGLRIKTRRASKRMSSGRRNSRVTRVNQRNQYQ